MQEMTKTGDDSIIAKRGGGDDSNKVSLVNMLQAGL